MAATPRDRGSTTAETAVALPGLVLLLAMAVWAVSAAGAQLQCADAARLGARAAARGDPSPLVRAEVSRAAPARARVAIGRDPTTTAVEVAAPVPPPLVGDLRALEVSARAVADTEPGSGGPPAADPLTAAPGRSGGAPPGAGASVPDPSADGAR
ncbi:MAG TPA: TadE family type IV pilus minor pilin [Streptosporangiaceae bacterium]|jgi:hypothetical protein